MNNDEYFSVMLPRDSEDFKEILKIFESEGALIYDLDADLEDKYQQFADIRKRPLLVFILGSSILSQEHFDNLKSVMGDKVYDSMDFLVQVVAGDVKVGFEIANFVRERVKGELTCIAPITLSGAGTLISLSSNEIIGGDITYICPLDKASIHPAIIAWGEETGQTAPMYFENEDEYNCIKPDSLKYAEKLLANNPSLLTGNIDDVIDHLTFRETVDEEVYLIENMKKTGLRTRLANGIEKSFFVEFEGIIPMLFSDHILLIQ